MEPSIAAITITHELWVREARAPNILAEAAAMRRLADAMAEDSSKTFHVCAELALELCRADSCGVSLSERSESGELVFRWVALAGRLDGRLRGTTPRDSSPSSICVDTSAPLLLRRPELVYPDLDVGVPMHDALLVPLTDPGSQLAGTIWILAHDPKRKFDGEDARVMQRIAIFTATALRLANAAQAARKQLRELDHRVRNTLTVTASLLRQQLPHVTDPAAREAIETARGRVLAGGEMHRLDAGAASGNLAAIVRNVGAERVEADTRLVLHLETEPITLPAHEAAVVALIVNELVTNAVHHGFRDRDRGTVSIVLRRAGGDAAELIVGDDGAPLQAERRDGVGFELVSRLAEQLGGTFVISPEPKRFTVSFPVPPLN